MVRPKDDVINFDCECGSNTFATYEAKIKGYTIKYANTLAIKKIPESLTEIHGLTMCIKCGRLIDFVVLQESL